MLTHGLNAPNIYCETLGPDQFGIIEKPLTLVEQIYDQAWLRKIAILVFLALGLGDLRPLARQSTAVAARSREPCSALYTDVANGMIPQRALSSIKVLLIGYARHPAGWAV